MPNFWRLSTSSTTIRTATSSSANSEELSHLHLRRRGYASSCQSFCALRLPQIIGVKYGTIPIVAGVEAW